MPNRLPFRGLALALVVLTVSTSVQSSPAADPVLSATLASPARPAAAVARDAVRHPAEELTFFGLKPEQTVVELWPGGGYWTDILGPYLASRGHYYVALPPSGNGEEGGEASNWHARYDSKYGKVTATTLGQGRYDIAPPGSVDLVLTFRNLHNWMTDGYAQQALEAAFRALKPGGILGIVAHRGRTDQPQDPKARNGYVRQDYTVTLAKRVGFLLVASSEVNANPKDTKDWVDGVWTLPPTLSQGEKDRARYMAIGEADNFVLKFKKPER